MVTFNFSMGSFVQGHSTSALKLLASVYSFGWPGWTGVGGYSHIKVMRVLIVPFRG